MSKITFDPELMLHLKTIYGDAELSDKTLQLIYNTWKVNPDWIRNAAKQKKMSQPIAYNRDNLADNSAASNPNNRNRKINVNRFQQGGTINNQEELQKAFMAYLIQDAAALGIQLLSEQDLQAYAQLLGEEGIQAKYQEFMQKMQGGVKARLGAKLEYYRKLKGVCPDGSQPTYFKEGGRFQKSCTACRKGKKVANPVTEFKKKQLSKRDAAEHERYLKDMSSAKDQEARDSLSINKYGDEEVADMRGHKGTFKNGIWTPDRSKYTKKDACGSKLKKKK